MNDPLTFRNPQSAVRNATDPLTFRNPQSPIPNPTGPLAGKSALLQPSISVQGWPTEAGSAALKGYVALEDATVAERLRAAGASLVGATRMAELGFGLAGDTTAQAVAQGTCEIALVIDTMGEARVMAAMAGAFGFKPSCGTISRLGLIGLVPSMECCAIVANSPHDVAAVTATLVGGDERDPAMRHDDLPGDASVPDQPDAATVVGVLHECLDMLEPAEATSFRAALAKLEAAGARVEEVSVPDFPLFRTVHNVVGAAEASSAAGKYDSVRYGHRAEGTDNWNDMYLKSRAESFGTLVKSYLFQGAYFQFEDYPAFENACRIRRRLVEQTTALFDKVDILACPTRRLDHDPDAAATIGQVYDAFALTLPANVTGQPSLSVPDILIHSGLDLGLQLTGAPLADVRLLSFAARLAALEH